jgi:diguanylate cyclase (GGDEF)-like protein
MGPEMSKPPAENAQCEITARITKEFAQVTRALKTLGAGNHTVLRSTDEQELLQDMCSVIVETGGYPFAFVTYAVHDQAKSVRWMAGVGNNIELVKSYPFTWAANKAGGTVTGTAIRTGRPVIGRIFRPQTDYAGPEYAKFQEQLIGDGYQSVSAFPLQIDKEVIGALVIAAGEPDAFDSDETKLLCELASDLAYGIRHLRLRVLHRKAQASLEHLAYHDELTGLPNRTLLLKVLADAMDAATGRRASLALLHLEVGRFDEINKVLGYRCGDELVQKLSCRLERVAGARESLARVGEAEFALLLPDGGAEYAIEVARRLLSTLQDPVGVGGLMVDARVDIGIALFPAHADNADALMRRAHAAMHQVKRFGGGYAVYTAGQECGQTRRLMLMGDLYHAVERKELRMYCQPKVCISTGRLCGAEALLRWQHPTLGMMPTIEFISLAEYAGMITPLTNWIMEAAFSQIVAWQKDGLSQALAINLSAHDLYDAGLVDRIRGLFSTWSIDPELIQFELTESVLMADPVSALETLTRLKQLDVKLFVDDYGTGYSSLSYLQKLPIDAIKIDQSFVAPMASSRDSATIVSSTIELGHNLGKQVVAEGVETQDVWDRLNALGCDFAQGYLISKPMPADQLRQWHRSWS